MSKPFSQWIRGGWPFFSAAAAFLSLQIFGSSLSFAQTLDRSLKPPEPEENSTVFRDMGVVQRKAVVKARKLLVSSYLAMDFSDGPYSMYGVNLSVGYAISDFWEIYLNVAPTFLNSKRSIVDKIESLTLQGGGKASIDAALAQQQYGMEVLWAPLYGKDSLGLRNIVRSDTFLKFGAFVIQYNEGQQGMKFNTGIGKTYFVGKRGGFRITASGNYLQTIVDGVKKFQAAATLEAGLVFYLL